MKSKIRGKEFEIQVGCIVCASAYSTNVSKAKIQNSLLAHIDIYFFTLDRIQSDGRIKFTLN
ncbi:hypothetical protein BH18THE2_BH18THE2_13620 [soil metagenome]